MGFEKVLERWILRQEKFLGEKHGFPPGYRRGPGLPPLPGQKRSPTREMKTISDMYRKQIVVFQDCDRDPTSVNRSDDPGREQDLCESEGSHFDSIYPKSYQEHAALCQSVVYELLYKDVMGVDEPVQKAADMIASTRQRGGTLRASPSGYNSTSCREARSASNGGPCNPDQIETRSQDEMKENAVQDMKVTGDNDKAQHPFPFRVARSLEPNIYRNVDYDISKSKNKASYVCDKPIFSPGDKCQVQINSTEVADGEHQETETTAAAEEQEQEEEGRGVDQAAAPTEVKRLYKAHIQDLAPDRGPVTVFVPELGEKRTVPYACLHPVPQPCPQETFFDGRRKSYKKRKDMSLTLPPFRRASGSLGMYPRHTLHRPNLERPPHAAAAHYNDQKRLPYVPRPSSNSSRPAWSRHQPGRVGENTPRPFIKGRRPDCVADTFTHSPANGSRRPTKPFHQAYQHQEHQTSDCSGEQASPILDPAEFPALPSRGENESTSEGSTRDSAVQAAVNDAERSSCSLAPSAAPLTMSTTAAAPSVPVPGTAVPCLPIFTHPPPPLPPQPTSSHKTGQPTVFAPYLVVPHIDSSANINFNIQVSVDPTGADLPQNDPDTLRFFFNLGVEIYQANMRLKLQQQQCYSAAMLGNQRVTTASTSTSTMARHYQLDTNGQCSSKNGVSDKDTMVKTVDAQNEVQDGELKKGEQQEEQEEDEEAEEEEEELVEEEGEEEEEADGASLGDGGNDSGRGSLAVEGRRVLQTLGADPPLECQCFDGPPDSGCASDVSSGTDGSLATDECCNVAADAPYTMDIRGEGSQSRLVADNHSDSLSQHSSSSLTTSNGSRKCSSSCGVDSGSVGAEDVERVRYADVGSGCDAPAGPDSGVSAGGFMSHRSYLAPSRAPPSPKLLKPLKDIPPRFQKMLSSNPAIRQEQFEGQPIMRQSVPHHRPRSVMVSAKTNLGEVPALNHQFNPNAEAFTPRLAAVDSTGSVSACPFSPANPTVAPKLEAEPLESSDCSSCVSSVEGGHSYIADDSLLPVTPGRDPQAPTYTIHIFNSAGCSFVPSAGACMLSNHAVSAASSGAYPMSASMTACPLPPESCAAAAPMGPPAPSVPPGGIVYYCQPQAGACCPPPPPPPGYGVPAVGPAPSPHYMYEVCDEGTHLYDQGQYSYT